MLFCFDIQFILILYSTVHTLSVHQISWKKGNYYYLSTWRGYIAVLTMDKDIH